MDFKNPQVLTHEWLKALSLPHPARLRAARRFSAGTLRRESGTRAGRERWRAEVTWRSSRHGPPRRNFPGTGLGINVPMFHITQPLGIHHLQQIELKVIFKFPKRDIYQAGMWSLPPLTKRAPRYCKLVSMSNFWGILTPANLSLNSRG